MALRTLRYESDELLRKKSRPVKEITKNILTLLDDMAETMHAKDGIGLAAPQVGILKRIVIIEIEEQLYELINPEILETDGVQERSEACLSLPGRSGIVQRPAYAKVKALNRKGEEIIVEGTELLAVALNHEIDHLDGVLYIDRAIKMNDDAFEESEKELIEEEV